MTPTRCPETVGPRLHQPVLCARPRGPGLRRAVRAADANHPGVGTGMAGLHLYACWDPGGDVVGPFCGVSQVCDGLRGQNPDEEQAFWCSRERMRLSLSFGRRLCSTSFWNCSSASLTKQLFPLGVAPAAPLW